MAEEREMIDDEAPRVAAGRGDADTDPAHGPGTVAASVQKKLGRHGASFGQGTEAFLRAMLSMARSGLVTPGLFETIYEYESLQSEVSTFEFACYRVCRVMGATPDEEKDAKWDRYLELLHHRAMVADFPPDAPKTVRIVKPRRYAP